MFKLQNVECRKFINLLILCISFFTLVSCLEDKDTSSNQSSTAAEWFSGVKSVKNRGGFPPGVLIQWDEATLPVSGYIVYALIKNPTTNLNEWTNISDVLSSDVTSYIHSATDQVISGQIISYKVKAVDLNNKEDPNNKQLSTVIFDGIQDIAITGKTTAVATISNSVGSFNEIRIYATPSRPGGVKQLVGKSSGSGTSISLTNLKSGMKYKFSASAYIESTTSEDGNEIYKEVQTYSDSFGSGKTTDNNFAFQNVRLVQSYGSAPNVDALIGNNQRTIKIVINPFLGATAATKYRVIRADYNQSTVDTTATTFCSMTSNQSCLVCNLSGAGPQTCIDTQLAAPPKRYKYAITLVKKDPNTNEEWAEELPTTFKDDFLISSWVAPDYMVQVNRESANYETCFQMKRPTDPRKKNRCQYIGIGAKPFNTGPGRPALTMDSGYYDFGYNLFFDRHQLACNWTRSPACGADGCIGVVSDPNNDGIPDTDNGYPSNGVGVDGNVFLGFNHAAGPNCFVKQDGSWKKLNESGISNTSMNLAVTIDPGTPGFRHKPTIHRVNAETAQLICGTQSSEYGNKRIPRRREYMPAVAFPYFEGEPSAKVSLFDRWMLQLGTNSSMGQTDADANWACASAQQGSGNLLPIPTSITQYIDPGNQNAWLKTAPWTGFHNQAAQPYFIGSPAIRNCNSRFGISQPFQYDHYGIWFSDQFTRLSIQGDRPVIYQGEASDIDDGARDFVSFLFDGSTQGGTYSHTNNTWGFYYGATTSGEYQEFPYYLPHLGVPLMQTTGLQNGFPYADYLANGEISPSYAGLGISGGISRAYFHYNSTSAKQNMFSNGRSSRASFGIFDYRSDYGSSVRCVVSPE